MTNRARQASERAAVADASAKTSLEQAQKARDAALAAGNAYLSVAEGRLAVREGEFFNVIGKDDVAVEIYQKTSPISEILISSVPAADQVRSLIGRTSALEGNFVEFDSSRGVIGGWLDAGKRVLGYIWSTAQFEFVRGVRHQIAWPEDYPYAPIIEFEDGGAVLGVKSDGRIVIRIDRESAREIAMQLNYTPSNIYGILPPKSWASKDLAGWCDIGPNLARGLIWTDGNVISAILRTDSRGCAIDESPHHIELITANGQSLCKGGGGDAVTLPEPPAPHNALMLNIGTRDIFSGIVDDRSIFDFMPAREENSDGLGESQGTALMAALYQKQLRRTQGRSVWCYVSHGKGGQRISDLGKGSVPFQNGMTEIKRAVEVASIYKKKVVLKMHTWTHGEADRGLLSRSEYADMLTEYFKDYKNSSSEILGEGANGIVFSIDQLTASSDDDASEVALAQLDVVERGIVKAFMSTSKYFFKDYYGYMSSVHLRSAGYDLIGEYHAKVYDQVCRAGLGWTGLRPIEDPVLVDQRIRLRLYIPAPPLVLDFVTLPDAGNGGLKFTDSINSAKIKYVSVADAGLGNEGEKYGVGVIDVELNNPPVGDDMMLEYAMSSSKNQPGRARAWGNLRDSDPAMSATLNGVNLWNWCLIFKRPVKRSV